MRGAPVRRGCGARRRSVAPRCDLVAAPGVQRVVYRQAELELAVVVEAEQMEAFGDSEQAERLWRRVPVLGDVGPVHDPSEQRDRGVVDAVLVDEHLERA